MTETLQQNILSREQLLTDVLRQVSRSFYLTLHILPAPIRDQIGLAYLFARAADTITDTDLLEQAQRLEFLKLFKSQFERDSPCATDIESIQAAMLPHQAQPGEQVLVSHLSDCFSVFQRFPVEDRQKICHLMQTLIPGMEMDLTVFSQREKGSVVSLNTLEDLDRYTYHVAGCVGEFWTNMMCAHLPSLAGWNVKELSRVGVRFGKGLQLTNILKDLGRDLARGRCYLPHALLQEIPLEPEDLLNPENLPKIRPLVMQLIETAIDHLDQGWMYTLAIPRTEVRLRLACMWPILFAGHTLRRVALSPDLLDPTVNVKIPKSQVKRIMAGTTATLACGYIWTAYWGHLRKRIL